MRIGVNGRFYAAPMTGVQRVAHELSARVLRGGDAVLLLPSNAAAPNGTASARGRLRGHAWEQLELNGLARRSGCRVVLHPANTAPGRGGPHVVLVHDVLPLTNPSWFAPAFVAWTRWILTRATRHAAAIVTVSAWSKAEIVRTLAVPPDRVHVVRQGISPFDAPASPATVARVRAQLGLPDRYLLAVGGDRRKNLAFLCDVIELWRSRGGQPPALVVVGEPLHRVHGASHAVPPCARRVGRVDDETLRALYTGALALCAPSLAEGFGRPALEALGCGTPAVVADYPAAHEVLGDAALIRPLEARAWSDTLAGLDRDRAHRSEWRAHGRRLVDRYRWSDAAARVLEICRSAAQEVSCASR